MAEQIPLYLGVPLAVLCVTVAGAAVALAVMIWRDRRR